MQAVKLAQQKLAAATKELSRATVQQTQRAGRSMQVSQRRGMQVGGAWGRVTLHTYTKVLE